MVANGADICPVPAESLPVVATWIVAAVRHSDDKAASKNAKASINLDV
jgi:hypothetical protein